MIFAASLCFLLKILIEVMIVLNKNDVAKLLTLDMCMELVAKGLKALSRGDAVNPLRPIMWLPDRRGLMGVMPAYQGGEPEALGVKVLTIFPGNHGGDINSHQGGVLMFDADNGSPTAFIDAGEVTAIRTAAASGVATQLLAREDAGDLAILGAGVLARTHLEAMRIARNIRRVRIWNRTPERAKAFADQNDIEAVESVAEAVRGADIICTLTGASEPVVRGRWIAPGAHINAVGSSTSTARELDTETVVNSRFFVDRRESALHEAGDFLVPKREGIIGDDHIVGELGEVLLGQIVGRQNAKEITLFKSLGLGIEDVVSGEYLYQQAVAKGVGTQVDFG